jgi:hypothetical protein
MYIKKIFHDALELIIFHQVSRPRRWILVCREAEGLDLDKALLVVRRQGTPHATPTHHEQGAPLAMDDGSSSLPGKLPAPPRTPSTRPHSAHVDHAGDTLSSSGSGSDAHWQ